MPYRIEDIDGLDESMQSRLLAAGVRTTRHVLVRWENAQHRAELLKLADGGAPALLRLVGLSDLLRLKGVGATYAALLWDAGITGAEGLGRAAPEAILAALRSAKGKPGSARRLPTQQEVAGWIADAQGLPPLGHPPVGAG